MKTFSHTLPAAILSIAIVVLALVLFMRPAQQAFGSVSQGSEYHSTTTTQTFFPAESLVETGNGALGSVVITGAATGIINIYDATTSNVNLRTGQAPTSTILIASFPASTAAGTYTIDRATFNGLYVSVVGNIPTSTITFR